MIRYLVCTQSLIVRKTISRLLIRTRILRNILIMLIFFRNTLRTYKIDDLNRRFQVIFTALK